MNFENELKIAIKTARKAMDFIMDVYNKGFDVQIKSDDSPVTEADIGADKLIRENLHKTFPAYAFLTEESSDDLVRLNNDYVWIVDPVDGTSDFVDKDGEFTTNIALAYKHNIVVGVVGVPCTVDIYYASKGNGAFVLRNGVSTKIHVNDKTDKLVALVSHQHNTQKILDLLKGDKRVSAIKPVGSSLKGCMIAEGKAELTMKYDDKTKEWDTAAFQGVIEEAGGFVFTHEGNPIVYNREDVYNRGGFVCVNKKENIIE